MAGTSKDEEDTYSSVIIVHEDGDTHMSAEEEDGGGAIMCEECGTTFPDKLMFETHLKTHNDSFSYLCHVCQQGFWDINEYESHLLEHERRDGECLFKENVLLVSPQKSKRTEPTENSNRYFCSMCTLSFSLNHNLKKHKRIMHKIDCQYLTIWAKKARKKYCRRLGEKLFCKICNVAFTFKINLKKHMETSHSDVIKTFKCCYCFKEFKDNERVQMHMEKVHCLGKSHKHNEYGDRKRFICSLCSTKFIYRRSLTRHLKLKHKAENEKARCNHCEQEFKSIYYLYKHIRSAHVDLMLKCKECGLPFRNMATLWRHMKVHRVQLRNQNSKCTDLNNEKPTAVVSESLSTHSNSAVSVKQEEITLLHTSQYETPNLSTDNQEKSQTKIINCQFCKEKCTNQKQLENHQSAVHCGVYFPLNCSECSLVIDNNQDLINHIRTVHYAHEIHKCSPCDMVLGLKGCPYHCLKSCAGGKNDILSLILKDFRKPISPKTAKEENKEDEEKALEHFVCEDSDDHFNYEATKLLIDGMQSRYTRMASAHRRPLVYQEIAEELMRYGYNMSSQDIKKKWCKIVSYFWSLRNRPDSQNWEFFEQLSTFLEIEDQALEAADDNFDRDSILALIECVRKRHDIFSQTSLHDRHALYSDISKEMKANGHCFSAVKIKRKWNYLLSKYKQEKEKEWVTEMWDYFEPMNDFIDPGSHGPALKGTGDKGEELQPPLSFGKASGSPTDISSTYNESSTKRATPLDSETSSHSLASTSGISKRFKLMDDYFTFLKERENEDRNYKKRKEKRSRMKLKMLGKIGTQLEAIAETQTEILREQNMILRSLKDILEAGK